MAWIETERDAIGRCRSHPHHSQSEGVCSSCLTEKLSTLTSSSVHVAPSCSSSASPSESPRSSVHVAHRRNLSEATTSLASSVSDGLKKSRSVAYVASTGRAGEAKKKGWFWSRLLRSKRTGRVVVAVADS